MNIKLLQKERVKKLNCLTEFVEEEFDMSRQKARIISDKFLNLIEKRPYGIFDVIKQFITDNIFKIIRVVTTVVGILIFAYVIYSITSTILHNAYNYPPYSVEVSKNERFRTYGESDKCIRSICVDLGLREPFNEVLNELPVGSIIEMDSGNDEIITIIRKEKTFVLTVRMKDQSVKGMTPRQEIDIKVIEDLK